MCLYVYIHVCEREGCTHSMSVSVTGCVCVCGGGGGWGLQPHR